MRWTMNHMPASEDRYLSLMAAEQVEKAMR